MTNEELNSLRANSRINEGDTVRVDFNGSQITLSFKAIVLYKPCDIGDSWVFRDEETGFVHHVSEGCTISKKLQ